MLKLSLIFIIFVAVIVLLARAGMWWMNFIIQRSIGGRNKAAELIINTRKAPQSWTVEFEKKIDELNRASPDPTKILKLKKKGKDICLKKVSGLINYFKTSTLVEDEKTRGILLGELENARDLWRKKSWEEIVAR